MSRSSQLFARVVLGSCLSVLPMGYAWTVERPAVKASSTGEVLKYETPSGESFLAVGLRAKDLPVVTTTRHHVVLMDTSASQFGEHRAQGHALLQAFLRSLPTEDQVSLFAVDVQAERLTSEFVAPNSDAVRDAIATLQQRAPLGATNFQTALDAAISALPKDSLGTLLYVGDGMSSVNLLSSETVRTSIGNLRSRQIPVSSYAVGPRKDLRLLGVMAQHTGGLVMTDEGSDSKSAASNANTAGKQLAQAAVASVFYPDVVEFSGSDLKLAVEQPLPLRADRETYILAKGSLSADSVVSAKGQLAGKPTQIQWPIAELNSQKGSAFLAAAFHIAGKDGGLVPYAGRELLATAWNEFDQRIEWLAAEGSQAVARKRTRDAERIAQAIQELEPENAHAKLLLASHPTLKVKAVSQQEEPKAKESLLDKDEFAPDASSGRSIILDEVARGQIIGEKLKLEVSRAIQEANAISATEPDAALTLLKRAYGAVKSTADASIDLRQQLGRQLQSVIADVRSKKEVAEQNQIKAEERSSVQEAEKRLIEKLQLEDERLEQLVDRVRALLAEAQRGNDEAYREAESAAQAAVQMSPNNGEANAARFNAEAAFQLNQAFRIRGMRADKFLATLEQVELSHVPFPDEPPVLFPSPEIWKAMTERRDKYKSVDLHKSSKAEERIAKSLDDQTEVNFTDSPLVDVIQYLSDFHNIPIIIDTEALNEEGIATDTPVTRTLAGVKLRSALKIMLTPLGLAYVIEDEVMKITTIAKEAEKMTTRVYPVGDLAVILIAQQGGQGGGQGGGGLGGGGGGQGQGGGGFGGGGQGQGGGGGFFNVPGNAIPGANANPAAPAKANKAGFNNRQVNESKKKRDSKK